MIARAHRVLPLLLPFLLAACGLGSVPAELRLGGAQATTGPLLPLVADRPVVALVDVEVFELGAALLPAPRAPWTAVARERVEAALDTRAREHRAVLLRPSGDGALERAAAGLREAVLVASRGPLRGSFVSTASTYAEPPRALPSLREASRPLASATGAEFALVLFVRESRGTETLRKTNNWRLSIGAAAGLNTQVFFGATSGYAVLVELATGRIVAGKGFVAAEPGPSLLDPGGAEAALGVLLGERGV